jgi:hypothetical protein
MDPEQSGGSAGNDEVSVVRSPLQYLVVVKVCALDNIQVFTHVLHDMLLCLAETSA